MKKSGSQQLLAKQRLPRASVRLHGLGECLLLLGSGFLTAGAQIGGLALPLGACLTASLPFGRRSLSAALGAAAGYALLCEPAMAAERIALTALLLAAIVVFQGTALPATRWFLPAMAAGTALVLGSLQVFGGNGGWRPALQWLTVSAAAGVGTAVLRCGTGAGERGRPLYFAALLSGLSGLTALGLPVDPGLIGGCAMVYGAPELSAVCAAAAALGLTGNLGWSVTAALLLPAVTARVVRSDLARALLGGALCCGVLWLGGVGTPAAFAAVGIGIPLGLWLRRTGALRASGPAAAEELAARRMGDAAQVLELLQAQLPVQERGLSEADSVYDGAAERICRCCARFHRCWQHNARQTYDALEQAAGRLLQRGKAEAADFSAEFREGCCHFDGFLAALDQELESMLYRRRYRVQLQESRALLSEEFGCVAEYLRRMQAELGAPQPDAPRYRAVTGICTAGRHGAAANGDRGACFPGPRNDYYVLLCDGMGTGEPAAGLSADCVHLLGDLLRAGVAPLDALRILNGTYLLRGDGCFSTVDLLHIDLTSGEAELLKWGAAPSYLRCGDTVKKLGTASLPPGVGVGGDHTPERYRLSLRGGEMLVLVSDGAGDAESAVAGFAGDSPRELAALLIAGLPAEDDMTAVAVALAPRASRD